MKLYYILLASIIYLLNSGCSKEFLDTNPDQSIIVPTTLADLQYLLENTPVFNENQPMLLEVGTDDYYQTDASFSGRLESQRNMYTWAATSNFYAEFLSAFDWDKVYLSIFTANRVLEGLQNIEQSENNQRWSEIKGTALFHRANAFYALVTLYAKAYNRNTASSDLGIILRLESDVNMPSKRSTVQESYDQIIADLNLAIRLLPATVEFKTNPSKAAGLALLARVYLAMRDYDNALIKAISALDEYAVLKDYNTVPPGSMTPFAPLYTEEVIFYSRMTNSPLFALVNGTSIVDTTLFASYTDHDLRKQIFYRERNGRNVFIGSYSSLFFVLFNGLATDELYLISAECYARQNNNDKALENLNALLDKRYETNHFTPVATNNSQESLNIILKERRKELAFRGIRWSDLKRLNEEELHATTLVRVVGGATYTLPPKDNRYVYPLPNSELIYNNVEQNPR